MISKKIIDKLNNAALPVEKCLFFLLGVYYNIPTEELKLNKLYVLQMIKLGILSGSGAILSTIGLFSNEEENNAPHGKYSVEDDVYANVDTYRKLFRKINSRVGTMAVKEDVIKKLIRWLYKNPSYKMVDVINKAKEYIVFMKENNKNEYITNADYFIYKITNGVENSTLSKVIDDDLSVTKDFVKVI